MAAAKGKLSITASPENGDRLTPTGVKAPARVSGATSPEGTPVKVASASGKTPSGSTVGKPGTTIKLESLIFDPVWYKGEYPDVAAAMLDAVEHYFDNGFREGRNPNRYFDTNWYASNNPDVAAAGLNPFLHYLLYGAREGRKPAP